MAKTKRKSHFVDGIRQMGLTRVVIVLLLATIGGWLSLALAISGITRTKNPQAALMLVPTESTALSARADQLLIANSTKASPQISKLARRALMQQAMNAKALRLLGYAAEIQGDRQRALSIINMATSLSRREAGAQLWLIEYYAQANDTAKTLKHYDILLSTKPDAQALLYPRLSNAIEDREVRAALLPYVLRDRPWITGFLSYAAGNSKDLTGLVDLIAEAKGYPKNGSERDLALGLIGRLISEKRFTAAQNIYLLVPGARAARLTNPAFDANDRNAQFGAMGWQVSDNPDASGVFVAQKDKKEPALAVFANSATTQKVASRLLYLQPGSYSFTAKISQLATGDGGYIRFQMHCPANEVATPFWVSAADPKRPSSIIEIPADCPVQFLEIIASGGDGQQGLEAAISSIAITQ